MQKGSYIILLVLLAVVVCVGLGEAAGPKLDRNLVLSGTENMHNIAELDSGKLTFKTESLLA